LRRTKLSPAGGENVAPVARRIVSPADAVSNARWNSAPLDTETRRPVFTGTAVHSVVIRYGSSDDARSGVAAVIGRIA